MKEQLNAFIANQTPDPALYARIELAMADQPDTSNQPLIMQAPPAAPKPRLWPSVAVAAGLALLLAGGAWLTSHRNPANPVAPTPTASATPTATPTITIQDNIGHDVEMLYDGTSEVGPDWIITCQDPAVTLIFQSQSKTLLVTDSRTNRVLFRQAGVEQLALGDLNGDGRREVCLCAKRVPTEITARLIHVYDYAADKSYNTLNTDPVDRRLDIAGGQLCSLNREFIVPWGTGKPLSLTPISLSDDGITIAVYDYLHSPPILDPSQLDVDTTSDAALLFDAQQENVDFSLRCHNPDIVLGYTTRSGRLFVLAADGKTELYAFDRVGQVYLSDLDDDGIREVCVTGIDPQYYDNHYISAYIVKDAVATTDVYVQQAPAIIDGRLSVLLIPPVDENGIALVTDTIPMQLYPIKQQWQDEDGEEETYVELWFKTPFDQRLVQLYDDKTSNWANWQAVAADKGITLTKRANGQQRIAAKDGSYTYTLPGAQAGVSLSNLYLADLNNDGSRELCMTVKMGVKFFSYRLLVYDSANKKTYQIADRCGADSILSVAQKCLTISPQQNLYHYGNGGDERPIHSLLMTTLGLATASHGSYWMESYYDDLQFIIYDNWLLDDSVERLPSTDSPDYDWSQTIDQSELSLSVKRSDDFWLETLTVRYRDNIFTKELPHVFSFTANDLNGDGVPELCFNVQYGIDDTDGSVLIVDIQNNRDYLLSDPHELRWAVCANVDGVAIVSSSNSITITHEPMPNDPDNYWPLYDDPAVFSLKLENGQPVLTPRAYESPGFNF